MEPSLPRNFQPISCGMGTSHTITSAVRLLVEIRMGFSTCLADLSALGIRRSDISRWFRELLEILLLHLCVSFYVRAAMVGVEASAVVILLLRRDRPAVSVPMV